MPLGAVQQRFEMPAFVYMCGAKFTGFVVFVRGKLLNVACGDSSSLLSFVMPKGWEWCTLLSS